MPQLIAARWHHCSCETDPIDTSLLSAATAATVPTTDWSSPIDWPTLFAPTEPIDVSGTAMLVILAIAAILSIPRATWQYFGLFTTLVHELGHGVAAVLTGRVVHGIRIRRNHSGDALSSGRGTLGTVISGVFGYPAPAIVGAAQLWSVFNGYTAIALFAGGCVLLITLLVIRNLLGIVVVFASAAVSAALWFYASPDGQSYALLVIGTALLVGSLRGLATVIGVHTSRRDQLHASDAYLLYRRTGVPSVIWLAVFTAVIAGCVIVAIRAADVARLSL